MEKGSKLTKRELEVLDLLSQDKRDKEVATCLGICETTVRAHVLRICHKVGAADRTQLGRPPIMGVTSART